MYKKDLVFERVDISVMSTEDQVVKQLYLPIDQFPVQKFNMNSFGHPRNVVSQLAHCQSLEEYNMIARNLQKNSARYALGDKFSVKDVFAQLKPRCCQMPTELDAFAESLKDFDMSRIEEAYKSVRETNLFGNDPAASAVPAAPVASAVPAASAASTTQS